MTGGLDWEDMDRQASADFDRMIEDSMKKGDAERDYFGAVRLARWQMDNEKLIPMRTEFGEIRYTAQQGLRAACLAHEGAMAARDLQLIILKRLDRNRNYLAIVIALLLYIAK